jgi:hypothetical protein
MNFEFSKEIEIEFEIILLNWDTILNFIYL